MVKEYLDYCDSPWGRFRLASIYNNILLSCTTSMNHESFLDIGCGPAHIVQYLAPYFDKGVAIDSSESMIRSITNRYSNVIYRVSSFEDYFPIEKFDLVLCHNVLEYQENKIAFLKKIARFLRDNNSLLSLVLINRSKEVLRCLKNCRFSEAKRLNEKGIYFSKTFDKAFYLPTVSEFDDLLLGCGFKVVSKRGIGVLYPNDYDEIDIDVSTLLERELRDKPNIIYKSTLIHFICKKNTDRIFLMRN